MGLLVPDNLGGLAVHLNLFLQEILGVLKERERDPINTMFNVLNGQKTQRLNKRTNIVLEERYLEEKVPGCPGSPVSPTTLQIPSDPGTPTGPMLPLSPFFPLRPCMPGSP